MSARKKPQALPPPILVDGERALAQLQEDLAGQVEIAFDTEADSFFHYQEKVCLIQITVEDRDYLVDPLADLDLTPLGDVLADPSKTKVFHDGEYDVLILSREFGWSFAGLFDTRVAAAALGVETPGLAAVLGERFGVELDKSLQRSNWSNRPLTQRQIDYARLDTHYLIPLMHEMREDLEARGRTMIVEGECRRLEALEVPERVFNPDEFLRLKGARTLGPMQMQTLRELYVLRDERARERDVPPFKVLGNPALVEVARAQPATLRQLQRVDGLSPRIVRRLGHDLVDAVARAKELGPMKRVPQLPSRDGTGELDEEQYELHERLKRWRKGRAVEEGLDASLVLNRHVLLRLAQDQPRSARELARVEGMLPWQADLFGEEILATIEAFARDLKDGSFQANRRKKRRRKGQG